jgi:hypothetical protein
MPRIDQALRPSACGRRSGDSSGDVGGPGWGWTRRHPLPARCRAPDDGHTMPVGPHEPRMRSLPPSDLEGRSGPTGTRPRKARRIMASRHRGRGVCLTFRSCLRCRQTMALGSPHETHGRAETRTYDATQEGPACLPDEDRTREDAARGCQARDQGAEQGRAHGEASRSSHPQDERTQYGRATQARPTCQKACGRGAQTVDEARRAGSQGAGRPAVAPIGHRETAGSSCSAPERGQACPAPRGQTRSAPCRQTGSAPHGQASSAPRRQARSAPRGQAGTEHRGQASRRQG